ncbi:hypothetical protein AK812_SmicGene34074 [Symbiodinium microadriaticum]|uniref:Uncharacterized protein n=1 Tax=Symbiodinium microadriaticum TaxID=2951 RepID=A0A1Q9CQ23_SYMMI|nr:hypothetical protein AK812_SmicGene34074 [Symbiodinium microadriaticum]
MDRLRRLLGVAGFSPTKIPTGQEVLEAVSCIFDSSFCAEHVDVFVSRYWSSARWAKYLALCLYVNLTAAVACSLTMWVLAATAIIACARGTASLEGNLLLPIMLVGFPIVAFLAVFVFGQHAVHRLRPMSMWLDRACIHQTDHDIKHRSRLPVFVARSSSMLVLWDETLPVPHVHFLPEGLTRRENPGEGDCSMLSGTGRV